MLKTSCKNQFANDLFAFQKRNLSRKRCFAFSDLGCSNLYMKALEIVPHISCIFSMPKSQSEQYFCWYSFANLYLKLSYKTWLPKPARSIMYGFCTLQMAQQNMRDQRRAPSFRRKLREISHKWECHWPHLPYLSVYLICMSSCTNRVSHRLPASYI